MRHNLEQAVVCVIGLGYVGLPLAQAFAKSLKVIGFDTDNKRIKQLKSINQPNLNFTANPKEISKADFIVICVPTPVTKSKEPDLFYVKSAAKIASQNMKKDSVVILESTVYPGTTEEVVKPILEESGLKCGEDFKIAYSPERINPGDKKHALDKITKVINDDYLMRQPRKASLDLSNNTADGACFISCWDNYAYHFWLKWAGH